MDTRGMFVVICRPVKRPQTRRPVHTFLAGSQTRRCSAFCFCFHTEGSRGRTREGAVQCSVGSSAPWGQLDGAWMPTLVPVSRAAPGKWLKSSEPHFLFRKINRIYQDEFLAFKVIIYGVYAWACVPTVCYQTQVCCLLPEGSSLKSQVWIGKEFIWALFRRPGTKEKADSCPKAPSEISAWPRAL